ncbi:ribosomal protein S18 acetylase RimI-like enzyme [Rhodococcus sp. 27YEA15]|uniref:GNAT family N-acetyltransferase n=1 Tax=Rhodococcus sp. 27YEA15 TaxID=3156259 RepID=UPI003C7C4E06
MNTELLAAMDRNLTPHANHLHHLLPESTVTDAPDLAIADSGSNDDTFNIVSGARFDDTDLDLRLSGILSTLRGTGRPFSWWTGPADSPADLGARLRAHGCENTEDELAMSASIDRIPLPDRHPALNVSLVTSKDQLADYAAVMAANWSPPSETVVDFFRRTASGILGGGSRSSFVVGYHDGRPVAGAEIHIASGVAGLYGVVTLEGSRRRGFGVAVTLAALDLARRHDGVETAVLQASQDGAPLYRRLGFEEVGAYTEYAIRGDFGEGDPKVDAPP